MLRLMPAEVAAAIASDSFTVVLAALIDFPSGALAIHDGVGSFSHGGNTYVSDGSLGGFDVVVEHSDFAPQPVRIILDGTDQAIIDAADNDLYHGEAIEIFWMFITADGSRYPLPLWSGFIDYCTIELGGGTASVTVTGSHELENFAQADGRRWTDEQQTNEFPGDVFFEFNVADRQIRWGGSIVNPVYTGGFRQSGTLPGGALQNPVRWYQR